jgi:hypothetical protein
MDDRIVDVTDEKGATVISIEVARPDWMRRHSGECQHRRVYVDEDLSELECRDCKAKINPVRWVMKIHDQWRHVVAMYRGARAEQARLETKRRVKCPSCGGFQTLYANRDDEKRRASTREGRLEEALKRIAVLVPQAAAKYAPEIAAAALSMPPVAARVADAASPAPVIGGEESER